MVTISIPRKKKQNTSRFFRGVVFYIIPVGLIVVGLISSNIVLLFGNVTSEAEHFLRLQLKNELHSNDLSKCVTNEKNQTVCVYEDICYNNNEDNWYIGEGSNDPMLDSIKEPELLLLNFKKEFVNDPRMLTCLDEFHPIPRKEKKKSFMQMSGTFYYLCCWTPEFGHVLINMVFPAFHALSKLFPQEVFSSIQYVVKETERQTTRTERGFFALYYDVLEFFTGFKGKVFSFDQLIKKAREEGKEEVCFDQLAAGMFLDSLIWSRDIPEYDIKEDLLVPMKDHVAQLYPLEHESLEKVLGETRVNGQSGETECNIAILERKNGSRNMVNKDEVLDTIKNIYQDEKWNIQTISFDDVGLESQYLTMQNTKLFLSVSGTGSHMAAYLPDGAASIEISVMYEEGKAKSVNEELCKVIPEVTCYVCPPGPNNITDWMEARFAKDIIVNIDELRHILYETHEELNDGCIQAVKAN